MNGAGADSRTTKAADLSTESAVLCRIIDVHPERLTIAELVRELVGEAPPFEAQDAIARAARELSGIGLLHLHDEFLTPTRAALRFTELLDH